MSDLRPGWSDLATESIPSTLSWGSLSRTVLGKADVLDLGCGPVPSFPEPDRFPDRWVGVDCNPSALEAARQVVPRASLVCADVTELPFSDRSFDLVLCKAVLTALVYDEACQRALAESHRVLRPGGTLLVADFLVNSGDTYFANRYRRGAAAGLPPGAFIVDDAEAAYGARHYSPAWLKDIAASQSGMKLTECARTNVHTRTGRPTLGFEAILHRVPRGCC